MFINAKRAGVAGAVLLSLFTASVASANEVNVAVPNNYQALTLKLQAKLAQTEAAKKVGRAKPPVGSGPSFLQLAALGTAAAGTGAAAAVVATQSTTAASQ